MTIEEQRAEARDRNELIDHLIRLIESDDSRYSFEVATTGMMVIYDKEKECRYVAHIAPIVYDEDGNAMNL